MSVRLGPLGIVLDSADPNLVIPGHVFLFKRGLEFFQARHQLGFASGLGAEARKVDCDHCVRRSGLGGTGRSFVGIDLELITVATEMFGSDDFCSLSEAVSDDVSSDWSQSCYEKARLTLVAVDRLKSPVGRLAHSVRESEPRSARVPSRTSSKASPSSLSRKMNSEKEYHAQCLANHVVYQKASSSASHAKTDADALASASVNAEKQRAKVAELEKQVAEMKAASKEAHANGDSKKGREISNELSGFIENELGPANEVLREYEALEERAKKEKKPAAAAAKMDDGLNAIPSDVKPPTGASADERRKTAEHKYLDKLVVFDKPPLKQELDKLPGGRPSEGSYVLQSNFEPNTRVITAIMLIRDKETDYDAARTNLFTDVDGVCKGVSFG